MKRLYEFTYPELLVPQSEAIVDWAGIMWCGPDRKGLNAPNAIDLWKAWQRDTHKACENSGVLTPRVMAYFQATKGFSKPPKAGELEHTQGTAKILSEAVEKYFNTSTPTPVYRFTWSYSQLNQFETCPFQWSAEKYLKTAPKQETEQTLWGTEVHTAFENYVKSDGEIKTLPDYFMGGIKWAKALVDMKKRGATVLTEYKMALNKKLQPVDFESDEAWARGIADVVVIVGKRARIWDWKTGKKKDDTLQLLIFCCFLAQHFPELEEFQAEFVWLKDDVKVGMPRPIQRKELLDVWRKILAMVKRMEDAVDNGLFIKKTSGLCKAYCSVLECQYNGRR